jgi:hypothetical protein
VLAHRDVNDLLDVVEVVVHRALGQRARIGDRACRARREPVAGHDLLGGIDDLLALAAPIRFDHGACRCHARESTVSLVKMGHVP